MTVRWPRGLGDYPDAEDPHEVGFHANRDGSVSEWKWMDGQTSVHAPAGGHLLIAPLSGPVRALRLTSGGVEIAVRLATGTVVFVPDGSSCSISASGEALRAIATTFPVGHVEAVCDTPELVWRSAHGEAWPRIADALAWLRRSDVDGVQQDDPLVRRLLSRLVACAFGGLSRRPDDAWLPAAALGRVSAKLAGDDLDGMSIAFLAREVGLGVSAFSRGFRGSTGWTPGDHLIEARLERVAALLSSTDLPLAEITRRVGLASVAHVSQQFGSRHGMSARRFRAEQAERPAGWRDDGAPKANGRKGGR